MIKRFRVCCNILPCQLVEKVFAIELKIKGDFMQKLQEIIGTIPSKIGVLRNKRQNRFKKTDANDVDYKHETEPADFEFKTFKFLGKNHKEMGVKNAFRFQNVFIDGWIELENGDCYALEIKYRMDWMKACQAEWQFHQFFKLANDEKMKNDFHVLHKELLSFTDNTKIKGCIVIFNDFSADWLRSVKDAEHISGWSTWYHEHHQNNPNWPIHLLKFDGVDKLGSFIDFPLV